MKRKNITQSSNKVFCNSPTIVRYNTMETNFQSEFFSFRDELNKANITDDDDDITNTDEL